ncbi:MULTISPECIES: glycosyltransferase family 4 protein [unclassified Chelatococcus]|uniref:glycosyltransferase family 4 protein n=1 Tax=unclassified Chelatococcus TaxID=2638111 RepID=UPI001BCE9B1A|nr:MULTISPECIES: glycosyltransferase family 4 protein [unclassified Chelatococcus]MBS7700043.1 glycosyltransferase family 4 protein [Chelatococcus sp. YT9]MBX3556736.1 glycosyltransferase family 4 protein [Chelatococcus sp.]
MGEALRPIVEPRRELKLFMTADAVGGVFTYAIELAEALTRHDVRTTLALLGPAPSAAQRRRAMVVPGLELLETTASLDWLADDEDAATRAAETIADLASRHTAEIVHLNTPTLALAPFEVPVVVALHSCLASWWEAVKGGPMPADFRWRTALTAKGLREADVLVCPSAAFASQVRALYGRMPHVVHNGRTPPLSDGSQHVAADPIAATEMPLAAGPTFVFTAGRLWDEGKNMRTLVDAARLMKLRVKAAGPLVGPNGTCIGVQTVEPLGALDAEAVRAQLASRPIFISTALYEPFGLSVLEAAQAGAPLVLSDIPTFRELWDGAALFAPPRDAGGFASLVNRLADRPDLRNDLGSAARRRAAQYTVETMAARMKQIYSGVMADRKGAAA